MPLGLGVHDVIASLWRVKLALYRYGEEARACFAQFRRDDSGVHVLAVIIFALAWKPNHTSIGSILLDSRRVLHPVRSVLGSKPHLKSSSSTLVWKKGSDIIIYNLLAAVRVFQSSPRGVQAIFQIVQLSLAYHCVGVAQLPPAYHCVGVAHPTPARHCPAQLHQFDQHSQYCTIGVV